MRQNPLPETVTRDIPLWAETDVVVCGAGPAGIGAAIAAARRGARTILVERAFCVGGMGSCTGINTWCDTPGGPIFDEMETRFGLLDKASRRFDPKGHTWERGRVWLHGETLKAVALRMITQAGARVLYGTTAAGVCGPAGDVQGIVAANKGGLGRIAAKTVIDCTADADIAASAGCEFLQGDPEDGRIMHVNFMFRIGGVDAERAKSEALPTEELLARIRRAHAEGSLRAPTGAFRPLPELFPYHEPEQTLSLDYWEIEKVDCSDPVAASDTVAQCQLIALDVIEFCRANLPGYEKCGIERFWEVLGTRESRRIVGRATVTRDDLLTGRKFEDGITQACFFIDFHDSPPGRSIPYTLEFKLQNTPPPGDFYEIPYGCLVPTDTRNLLVAGRCISCDRDALSSLRVMPTCMYLGEAAGTAAALALEQGVRADEIDGRQVKPLVIPGA